MSDPRRDRRLIDRQLMGLDPRDNITVIPGLGRWLVMSGAALVGQFDNHRDAHGFARRLCEGSKLSVALETMAKSAKYHEEYPSD